ncbi:splicing factor 3B subunit 2 [Trichonephila inaurata madagascariensis]|uniref:Splicing factor 3B subunit 2 n=1 Tax=Trichonephila inaurata madagascariensis TaxID=2747483 RepID=A0A8X6YJK5_9ARAC|nr:splicing factor 3B subunit 2 [Trichonephila inaurata madagascariensis]
MLRVGSDAVAQPVTVPEEKGLPRKVCFNPNLKASSNVIFVQHHWRKYSQVLRGVEKPTPKLPFIQRPTVRKKVRFKSRMSDIDSPKLQNSICKRLAKPKAPILGDLRYEGKTVTPALWDGRDEEKIGKRETLVPFGGPGW